MKSFNKEGLRFIIGTLVAAVTAVLVASIISTSLGTLAEAIRGSNGNSSDGSGSSTSEPNAEDEIHQVTFNPSGGSAVNPATLHIRHGEYILNFPASTLPNNTFIGWYTGVTPNDVLFTGTMPVVQDMTLFARWQLIVDAPVLEPGTITWRVAFNPTGGSPVDTVQVSDGRTMDLPPTTRDGYVFLGWFTGDLPGDIQFTASMIINRDMTLIARWERESFMITFLTYGGSFVTPIIAKADSPITAPATPTKQNFSFGGWFTTVEYSTEFDFTTMPSVSTTLHAFWIEGTFEGLEYFCTTSECIITGYDGVHSSIYIPSEINELPVTLVSDRAFEGNSELVSITFEDSFEEGEGVVSSLKTIGTSAFANMSRLRSLALPQTALKTIKNDAFRNSSLLTAVDIPAGVTILGTNVLTGADSLERVTVRPDNNVVNVPTINFKYLFGGTAFNTPGVSVPLSLKTVIVSEGATNIPADFLRDLPMISEVIMPKTLTTVGLNVLTGATNLETLTWTFTSLLTNNNSFLGYAFGSSTNSAINNLLAKLKTVTINETTTTTLGAYALYNLPNVTSLTIPDNITEIQSFAFAHPLAGTSQLQYFDLPSELVTLGTNVFQNSSALLELDVPDSVITIGTNFLTGTNKLHTLSFNHNSPLLANRFLRYFFGGGSYNSGGTLPTDLKRVEVRGEPTALATGYFFGFTSIETILLPTTLTTLNNETFRGMTSLKQIQNRGQTIEANRIILPDSITTFGTNMFQGATAITHVKMPASLTSIPVDTFNGATNLETVIPPTAYTTIGINAFLNTKLSTFTFSSSLTSIGISAFQGTLLSTVVVPNSVTIIGNDAFRNMNALTAITFPSVVPTSPAIFQLGTHVLTGAQVLTTINTHINVLPSTNNVLRYFFGGTTTLNTGTLPTTLTTVNLTGGTTLTSSFFQNATTIVNVTLPSSLMIIGASAFEGAIRIKELTIPALVDNLGAAAFRGMIELAKLTFLRETLPTTIGANLFTTTSAVGSPILENLFIFVPTEAAVNNYNTNLQFNAFATPVPTRLVASQAEPEVILP
jgi:hypothetical protein